MFNTRIIVIVWYFIIQKAPVSSRGLIRMPCLILLILPNLFGTTSFDDVKHVGKRRMGSIVQRALALQKSIRLPYRHSFRCIESYLLTTVEKNTHELGLIISDNLEKIHLNHGSYLHNPPFLPSPPSPLCADITSRNSIGFECLQAREF